MSRPHIHIPLLDHVLAMLEDVPVGLLLLDAAGRPLWFNDEAARACAVWNHGERHAAALRARNAFRVPEALTAPAVSCRPRPARRQPSRERQHPRAARAHQAPHRARRDRAGLHIQLDYRRPRGGPDRQLSRRRGAARPADRARARGGHAPCARACAPRDRRRAAPQPPHHQTQLAAIFAKLSVRGRTRVAALLNR